VHILIFLFLSHFLLGTVGVSPPSHACHTLVTEVGQRASVEESASCTVSFVQENRRREADGITCILCSPTPCTDCSRKFFSRPSVEKTTQWRDGPLFS